MASSRGTGKQGDGDENGQDGRVDSGATPPSKEKPAVQPQGQATSGTNTTATRRRSRGTEGGGGPHHRKGEGADATGRPRGNEIKNKKRKKATSASKVSHQFLLSSFSISGTDGMRSQPHVENIFMSSFIYEVPVDAGTRTALLTVRLSERGLRRGGPPMQSPHESSALALPSPVRSEDGQRGK